MTDFLQEFKAQPNWLVWREERRGSNGKPTKVPYTARGSAASSTDPATWATYDEAAAVVSRYDGLGFAITGDNVLVDLDGCRNPQTGVIEQWGSDVVEYLLCPTEVSPSGTGLHIYLKSQNARSLKRMFVAGEKRGIEIYAGGRYSAITFNHFPGTPHNIPDIPEADFANFITFVKQGDFDPEDVRIDVACKRWEQESQAVYAQTRSPLDLEHWLSKFRVEVLKRKSDGTLLIVCPGTHGEYDNRDGHAFLKQLPSGALAMGCLHQSCSLSNGTNRWKEFRQLVEGPRESKPPINGSKQVQNQHAFVKRANWQTFAEVKPEILIFLWPQRVPLKFGTAFIGDPDMGKSLMSLDFMARLSRGKPFLDGSENPHGVVESILLSTEDDPNTTITPRLMAAGADLSKIHRVDTIKMFDAHEDLKEERLLTLESDLAVIRSKIESNPAIKLLVIDPFSNYLGSQNLMKEQEVRSVLMPVVMMAQELNIAVIVIMHNSKTEGRSAMHKAIGAVGAVGCLRMAWSFVKSQDDETVCEMLQSKKNLGRFPGLRFTTESANVTIEQSNTEQALIKYLDVSNASIENVLAAQEDKEARQERPAIAFLKKNLPKDGTHHSDPLIQKAKEKGISRKMLFSARQNLDIDTEKIGGQWFWSWPSEATQ